MWIVQPHVKGTVDADDFNPYARQRKLAANERLKRELQEQKRPAQDGPLTDEQVEARWEEYKRCQERSEQVQ